MITKQQATDPSNREFHCGNCTQTIGPRGGKTTNIEVWRRNGNTKTWVTRPDEFSIPVKYGFTNNRRNYNYITQDNAANFHLASECPLINA